MQIIQSQEYSRQKVAKYGIETGKYLTTVEIRYWSVFASRCNKDKMT